MIRIGIVGCGRILNAHLHGYRQLIEAGQNNFRITALCARNKADALMFRRRGEGPPPRPPAMPVETGDPLAAPHIYLSDFQPDTEVAIFTDYQEMIDSGLVDAVNDFTTLAMHHQIGTAVLMAGKHLLVEKPLAITVKAGQHLLRLAQQKNLTLGLFENVRQMLPVRVAKWIIDQGYLGELQMAFIGGIGGPWSPDKIVAGTSWRHEKLKAGGGGAIDIGVHAMHWLRYVCGEIETIQATVRTFEPKRTHRDDAGETVATIMASVDDTYLATVTFANGALGQLAFSWAGHGPELPLPGGPAFFGSQGSLQGDTLYLSDGRQLGATELFEAELDAKLRSEWFPLGLTDPFAIQQLDWLRAIEQRAQPETDGDEGVRDLAAAYGMIESSNLGRRVEMAEMLSGDVEAYQMAINDHFGL